MKGSNTQRLTWEDLPQHVQDWVHDVMGASVISSASQSGGFSLGTADRLLFSDGRRAFLKAVNSKEQEFTAKLHAQEAVVLQSLPESAPVAGYIAHLNYDQWVAVLIEDIEGRHPHLTGETSELAAIFSALDEIAELDVSPALHLETTAESVANEIDAWDTLAHQKFSAQNYAHLENHPAYPEFLALIPELNCRAADYAIYVDRYLRPYLEGNSYNHTDIRADNILLTPENQAIIVDWPWACIGHPAADSAALVVDVLTQNPHRKIKDMVKLSRTLQLAPGNYLEANIVYAAGFYTWAAQFPPNQNTLSTLPGIRFSRALALNQWVLHNI